MQALEAGVISLSCHDACDHGLTPTRWIAAGSRSCYRTVVAKTATVAIAVVVVAAAAAAVAAIQLALSDNELFGTDRDRREHKTTSRRRQRLQDTSVQ